MPSQEKTLAWPLVFTFLVIMGWMAFEGDLIRVVVVGVLLTVLWGIVGVRKLQPKIEARFRFTGFTEGWPDFLLWVVGGGLIGLTAPLMVISLMIFKTGIHSHGPEFSPAEIEWVLGQFALWCGVGLLAGLGCKLCLLAIRR